MTQRPHRKTDRKPTGKKGGQPDAANEARNDTKGPPPGAPPAAERPATKQPAAERSNAERPATKQPGAKRSNAEQHAAEQPEAKQPAAERSNAERPAAERPTEGYLDVLDLGPDLDKRVAGLTTAAELRRRNRRLREILRSLDLCHLTDQQLKATGGIATPQEQVLFAGVTDFVRKFAPQLRKLGFPVDRMAEAFAVDAALIQCQGATEQVMDVSGEVVLLVNAAMTRDAQKAERAAADLMAAPSTSVADVRDIASAFAPLGILRQRGKAAIARRRQKRAARQRK